MDVQRLEAGLEPGGGRRAMGKFRSESRKRLLKLYIRSSSGDSP